MGITAVKCRGRFWGYTEGARSANTRNPLFKAGRVPEPTRGQPSPAVRSSAARQVLADDKKRICAPPDTRGRLSPRGLRHHCLISFRRIGSRIYRGEDGSMSVVVWQVLRKLPKPLILVLSLFLLAAVARAW